MSNITFFDDTQFTSGGGSNTSSAQSLSGSAGPENPEYFSFTVEATTNPSNASNLDIKVLTNNDQGGTFADVKEITDEDLTGTENNAKRYEAVARGSVEIKIKITNQAGSNTSLTVKGRGWR